MSEADTKDKKEHDIDYKDPEEEKKGTFEQKVRKGFKLNRQTYQR